MAFSFSNDAPPPLPPPEDATPEAAAEAEAPQPTAEDTPQAAALTRFRSCRWMQPAENGNAEFCTHREVKPYAGATSFDAAAWCPDCQHYKLRRTPKKRSPEDYSY